MIVPLSCRIEIQRCGSYDYIISIPASFLLYTHLNLRSAVGGDVDAKQSSSAADRTTETTMEEMAPFPNYIPSTSCGMPRKTPPENIQAFYGTVRGRSA